MNVAPPCFKCVWYRPGKWEHTGTCRRYVAYRGRGKLVYEFADAARADQRKCGPDGLFFVAREKKVPSERQELLWHLLEQDE